MQYPDPALTPGSFGPTRQARDVSWFKRNMVFRMYGIGPFKRLLYTIDHLIPLELNGTNNLDNLWPQPRREAKRKDADENFYARQVASGQMALPGAQRFILIKWGGGVRPSKLP